MEERRNNTSVKYIPFFKKCRIDFFKKSHHLPIFICLETSSPLCLVAENSSIMCSAFAIFSAEKSMEKLARKVIRTVEGISDLGLFLQHKRDFSLPLCILPPTGGTDLESDKKC